MIVVETLRTSRPPAFRMPWCRPFGAVWVPVYPAPLGHVLTTWLWQDMPEIPPGYEVRTLDPNGWECWTRYDAGGQVVGRTWQAPARTVYYMSRVVRRVADVGFF